MTLNPDLIRMRCAEIEESVQRLEPIARMEIDAFLVDQDLIDIACYRLLIAIEASLALCYHVSARRLRKAPEDYAACFGGLGDAELLAPDLVKRLQQMARFRNLLVHVYWKIDYRQVHAMLGSSLTDLRSFSAAIVSML